MPATRVSDEAVKRATGKTWKQWVAILDKAGAMKMKHVDIARLVNAKYLGKNSTGVNVATSAGWWSQMVTVEYERTKGLRQVNQYAEGFLVAVHRTVPGTVASLQRKWSTLAKSPALAPRKLERIPSKTKRAMIRYQADVGRVVVMFDDRGKGNARIVVESTRLPKKSLVEPMRAFWKKQLELL